MNKICKAIGAGARKILLPAPRGAPTSLTWVCLLEASDRVQAGLSERRVSENDALAALHLLKLLAVVEARHDFEGIYQAAYQREVIEFICLLMRRDCEWYTSPATLPPVKTICLLLQSNPTFVLHYNQTPFCHLIRGLCVFGTQTRFICARFVSAGGVVKGWSRRYSGDN